MILNFGKFLPDSLDFAQVRVSVGVSATEKQQLREDKSLYQLELNLSIRVIFHASRTSKSISLFFT